MRNLLRIAAPAFLVVTFSASVFFASEIVGIYVMVDKVILEPNETSPQSIQVWGAFTKGRSSSVERGYMYFSLPAGYHPDANEAAKKEWADLKAVAGTGKAVAFGQRFFPIVQRTEADAYFKGLPRVRPASEKPQTPDLYPVNIGMVKLTDTRVISALRDAKK